MPARPACDAFRAERRLARSAVRVRRRRSGVQRLGQSIGWETPRRKRRQRQRRRIGWQAGRRLELQLRRGAAAERVAERPPNQLVDVRLVAKADLRLRRMHVDVHRVGRHLDEEMHLGAALLDRRHAVGIDDRVRDGPVLDDAAVDEDVLRPARRPLLGQRRDEAEDLHVAAVAPHFDQIGALAVQLVQAIAKRRDRRALQHLAPGAGQREADLRIAERQLRDDARDLRGLGARRTSGTCGAPAGCRTHRRPRSTCLPASRLPSPTRRRRR